MKEIENTCFQTLCYPISFLNLLSQRNVGFHKAPGFVFSHFNSQRFKCFKINLNVLIYVYSNSGFTHYLHNSFYDSSSGTLS